MRPKAGLVSRERSVSEIQSWLKESEKEVNKASDERSESHRRIFIKKIRYGFKTSRRDITYESTALTVIVS